jgi:metallophosphoesterase superfamily enzyme
MYAQGMTAFVAPAAGRPSVPRWASEILPATAGVAWGVGVLRAQLRDALVVGGPSRVAVLLTIRYEIAEPDASALADYVAAQRRGGWLPLVERGVTVGARLRDMAYRLDATRLVIAGDLRHSTRDVDDLERAEVQDLASALGDDLTLDVVPGNHDRGGTIIGRERAGTFAVGAVDVTHAPPARTPARWTVCGHLHPRTTVRDETGASARFPCALVGHRLVVLPAFTDWAGGSATGRLMELLPAGEPAGEWRALPASGGVIADVGIVLGRERR